MAESLMTGQHKWTEIRSNIAHDGLDSGLTVTTRTWATRTKAKLWKIPLYMNALILRFRMGGSITSCAYEVYVYRNQDDAEFVMSGTAVRGTQTATMQVVEDSAKVTTYYADQITISDRWLKECRSTDETGNNEMAKAAFDACGAEYLLVQMVATCTGEGSMSVDVTGF